MDLSSLLELCRLHSTPGDEGDVAGFLLRCWRRHGLVPEVYGRYAVAARIPGASSPPLTVLVCAHMDSPGYVVQSVRQNRRQAVAVALGGAAWDVETQATQAAIVKTASGCGPCVLRPSATGRQAVHVTADLDVARGDRICFPPQGRVRGGRVQATFLDNRIGCFLLAQLAGVLRSPAVDVVLAATASEEFGGFGAAVLAARVQADLVICLDATYADKVQGVRLGGGPVVTLSDASVLVGRQTWSVLERQSQAWGLPLQAEIYNYSGTDARAFPAQGSLASVLPLLVATEGNHSPLETAGVNDLDALAAWLCQLCGDRATVAELIVAGVFGEA